MRTRKFMAAFLGVLAFCTAALTPVAHAEDKKDIIIGFAAAKSGWLEAFDTPAVDAALVRIDEINAAGGIDGRKVKAIFADTKTDRAQAAKAALQLIDQGADMIFVGCDYDFGVPAASVAEKAGKISMFLCAEDAKAGVQGVGKYSFTASGMAAVQGATMAEWSSKKLNLKTYYVLVDTMLEYNKSICKGFDWMADKLKLDVVGRDSFKADDPSVAAQISRIKALPAQPDAIMLCTTTGGVSAMKQIRAAGITSKILNGSAMDGTYWLSGIPDLTDVYVPVQGSIYGDDPNPKVEEFNKEFEKKFGSRPSSTYAYPGYIGLYLYGLAVERAHSTDSDKVLAEMNKFDKVETPFGPRSFKPDMHIQNQLPMRISLIKNGKPGIIDTWTISEPVPMAVALKK